jgi:hypothetical protein
MPLPEYTAAQWARVAITGNPDAASPTDDALAPFLAQAELELLDATPCVAEGVAGDGEVTLTGRDLENWNMMLGYSAAVYRSTVPGVAGSYSGNKVTVQVGPVRRTVENTSGDNSNSDPVAEWAKIATAARLRVSCVALATGQSNASGPAVMGFAGARRASGHSNTVEGRLLGQGSGCRLYGRRGRR